jgi:hypothetical protein
LNFKGDIFLIVVRDSLEIGVENLHVFGEKDLSVVHCYNWLIASYLDKHATLIKS